MAPTSRTSRLSYGLLACFLAVICPAQQPASDNTIVVGNQAQPVQWEHRGNIADAIARAGPKGTVWIPSSYTGTDCTPVSSCNPGTTLVFDLRGGLFQPTPPLVLPQALTGTTNQTVVANNQISFANPTTFPGSVFFPTNAPPQGSAFQLSPQTNCLGQGGLDQLSTWTDLSGQDWPMFYDGTTSDCRELVSMRTQPSGLNNGTIIGWNSAGNGGKGDFEPPPNTTIDPVTGSFGVNGVPTLFDVKKYGAKGDGVTNDLAAINAALAACSGKGGIVLLPATSASYFINFSIQAVSNCTLEGQGLASITIPAAGWPLVVGTGFGMVNIYQINNFRVTGIHFIGNKTAANANNSPKFIYLDPGAAGGAQNIQIDHNLFDTSAFEGIWVGCTACGAVTSPSGIHVSDNDFIHSGYGGANATQGLPAIQCNWKDGVISNNHLLDVGTGIGCSVGNSVIIGNTIDQFTNQGIAIGDGGNFGPYPITGNTVLFSVIGVLASSKIGYFIDGGVSGINPLEPVTGNACELVGTVGVSPKGVCFEGAHSPDTFFGSNTAEIQNSGTGFAMIGSTGAPVDHLVGNTCRYVGEVDQEECFSALPNGVGNTLTVFSENNHAYGLTRTFNSYGFDYNVISGGTLNAASVNDSTAQGLIRFGANSHFNDTGTVDNAPFSLNVNGAFSYLGANGYVTGNTYTRGAAGFNNLNEVACFNGNIAVQDCPVNATNPVGVVFGATTQQIPTAQTGIVTVLFDGTYTPSAGWFACTSSSTGGKVTPQVAACPVGRQVGIITTGGTNITSGLVFLELGTGSALSTAGNLGFTGGKGQHINTQAANNDISGTCTAAAATTCTVTFTTNYTAAPACTVTDQTNIIALKALPSTTTLVITTTGASSDVFSYICVGNPN